MKCSRRHVGGLSLELGSSGEVPGEEDGGQSADPEPADETTPTGVRLAGKEEHIGKYIHNKQLNAYAYRNALRKVIILTYVVRLQNR